jgi:hypothetical protein
MSAEIIFESPSASMWFHSELKIIHHRINRYIHDDEFRDFMMLGTQTMKEKQANKWLSDDRNINVVNKADMDWGAEHWFPKTVEAGWKYWAIVNPKNVIGQLDLEMLAKRYGAMGIETRFFNGPDDALSWLESLR